MKREVREKKRDNDKGKENEVKELENEVRQ